MLAAMDLMERTLAGMGAEAASAGHMAVLVILPHNPGDVVMALQAIRLLKADRPDLDVDYLVSHECRDLVRGSPLIRKVHILPERAIKHIREAGDGGNCPKDLEAFLKGLSDFPYDLSLNLFQEKAGAVVHGSVQAGRKAGMERLEGGGFAIHSRFLEHLFAIPADRGGNAWHAVDIYVRAARRALEAIPIHILPGDAKPLPWGAGGAASSIFPPLTRPAACASLADREYLVFHPGSAWPGKRWPAAHWAGLADRCAAASFPIVFTGSPDERPLMDRILAEMDGPARKASVDCVGSTDLPGAAWICAHARMVITGDTVAMHLAAAAGTATLCLFGASNPVETGPYGKGHVIIQTDPDPPPDLAFGNEHPGLTNLSAEEVADYLLEGVPPPGFALWETCWDGERNRQTLRDYQGRPPSGSQRALRLADALDRLADRPDSGGIHPLPKPREPADNLRGLLIAAVGAASDGAVSPGAAEGPWAGSGVQAGLIARIEAAERELSRDTAGSLVWEAYRIAINGLPLGDIGAHLDARLARLVRAIKEDSIIRNP